MGTSEEVKAAVERLRGLAGTRCSLGDIWTAKCDVADAYLTHITEQERVAAERVLPITEEWLVSIGGKASSDSTIAVQFEDTVFFNAWGFDMTVCNARPDIRTRGEVLDLLSALKIKVSLDAKE